MSSTAESGHGFNANQLYIKHVIVLTIACEYAIQVLTINHYNHNIEYDFLYYYSPDSLHVPTQFARHFCSVDVMTI